MAGKKKKSMANKLAKMSDEERARYLQHRAEMEEEARRRKQQLIATFMKKKIKKEEAFSRLNLAKINQHWHQIMRKIKVKEMKDEVEYMKRWIERVMEYKNRRISKLMEELEEAEEQYLNNFNSHSIHLSDIIENQNDYIDKLQAQYQEELDQLIKQAQSDKNSITEQANEESAYLRTVIYGQDSQAKKAIRESWEEYSRRLYEVEYNNKAKLRELQKTRGNVEAVIWQQILQVVRMYVQTTDTRRSHLQELRRIDAESAEEIRRNEEKMMDEEELIKTLTITYEDLEKSKSDKLKSLEAEETVLKNKFTKIRKVLRMHLNLDEKQLKFLTSVSNETLHELNLTATKGNHLMALSDTCQKFNTVREQVTKWLPIVEVYDLSQESGSEKASEIIPGLTDDEKLSMQAESRPMPESKSDLLTEAEAIEGANIVPKILIGDGGAAIDFLDECYQSLEKLENFWTTYNKVEVDVIELKREKATLEGENKQLRGLIRAVLEAAALAKTIPDSRVSTRAPSKRRNAYSAPLRRITFI